MRLRHYVCPFLLTSNLCHIYPIRQEVRGCLTIKDKFNKGILPVGCGYGGGKAKMVDGKCEQDEIGDAKYLPTIMVEGKRYVKINA